MSNTAVLLRASWNPPISKSPKFCLVMFLNSLNGTAVSVVGDSSVSTCPENPESDEAIV